MAGLHKVLKHVILFIKFSEILEDKGYTWFNS